MPIAMKLAVIGTLSRRGRESLAAARIAIASTAPVALVVSRSVPVRVPDRPWLWCPANGAADPAHAAAAIAAGAYDVVDAGGDLGAVVARRLRELAVVEPPLEVPDSFIGTSAAAQRLVRELDRAAQTAMAVLLTGETGTGKEVAARYLHARSGRVGKLVPINCSAIPNELIEGELFGYVRGAFSGAVQNYDGLFRAAANGTVFLDECEDTPRTLQTKLLRVLEDRVVSRLGENEWREVDFRIVAASNDDLRDLVRRGQFGADLYQRLAILRIDVPPLRERLDDLVPLVDHLIARFYREEDTGRERVTRVSPGALAALARYPWPGNIRELRNVIAHALVHKRAGDELLLGDLPANVVSGRPDDDEPTAAAGHAVINAKQLELLIDRQDLNLRALRDELERTALTLALARAGGSPTRAAHLLGEVGRGSSRDPGGTVRAMMRRHKL